MVWLVVAASVVVFLVIGIAIGYASSSGKLDKYTKLLARSDLYGLNCPPTFDMVVGSWWHGKGHN